MSRRRTLNLRISQKVAPVPSVAWLYRLDYRFLDIDEIINVKNNVLAGNPDLLRDRQRYLSIVPQRLLTFDHPLLDSRYDSLVTSLP